jgi:hypothetical protein
MILPAFLLAMGTIKSFGQHYCNCDSIQKNKAFTGFCVEYLDKSLVTVK